MKKLLAVLMSVLLIVSALSVLGIAALAEGSTQTDSTASDPQVPAVGTQLGDVNGDGKISVVDAKNILQHIAGKKELSASPLRMADVNSDGKVTIVDAKIILKVVAGTGTIDDPLGDEGWVDI